MDNKVCAKPMYKCAVCDEVYDSIAQRTKCEQACLKKQEEEERKAAELKKAEEYEARKNEVDDAFNKAYELKDKFVQDYGRYTYSKPVRNSFDGVCLLDWFSNM